MRTTIYAIFLRMTQMSVSRWIWKIKTSALDGVESCTRIVHIFLKWISSEPLHCKWASIRALVWLLHASSVIRLLGRGESILECTQSLSSSSCSSLSGSIVSKNVLIDSNSAGRRGRCHNVRTYIHTYTGHSWQNRINHYHREEERRGKEPTTTSTSYSNCLNSWKGICLPFLHAFSPTLCMSPCTHGIVARHPRIELNMMWIAEMKSSPGSLTRRRV